MKVTRLRLELLYRSCKMVVLKIIVSQSLGECALRTVFFLFHSGFVYRHTAAGLPTEGLYAHYDISTELGKGSFATVRKAVSRTTGEWYAVKMIQDSKRGKGVRNTALAREITIMERLKHPNICELKEVFFQDNGDISQSSYFFCRSFVDRKSRSCPGIRGWWRSSRIHPFS
jgi:serine/threonine protein kinase